MLAAVCGADLRLWRAIDHDDLAAADLASCGTVPVIEIAFDVAGTPFYKRFLKACSPCLQFLIGRRDLDLLCKNNQYPFLLFCQSGIGVRAIRMTARIAPTNAADPMTANTFLLSFFFAAFPISAAQATQTAAATSAMPSVSHSQDSSYRIFMRSSSPFWLSTFDLYSSHSSSSSTHAASSQCVYSSGRSLLI